MQQFLQNAAILLQNVTVITKCDVCYTFPQYCCDSKQLNYWVSCINDYTWNPRTSYCECNKANKIDEYLDIKNCSCENAYFTSVNM